MAETWEAVYTVVVLFLMFAALISDKFGADHVMAACLTAFLVVDIIDTREALRGFSSEGLWTVMVLFVVAEGIQKTGALDGYLLKVLGSSRSTMVAQLRLMIPIAIVSAFLNNTPIVVVMIPIIQRWARNTGVPIKQLLIPLSYASIFGGTCTLIGTSTNLVVSGLLETKYPNMNKIGMFDLSQFGVPIAMAGISYVVLMTIVVFPRSRNSDGSDDTGEYLKTDNYLLGARVMPWSPAVGRTVHRSGLRDTGGIYLVSVLRAATGNIHRAVSRDFVLNAGDVLYFTGLVETFGEFCAEHGLKVVTSESIHDTVTTDNALATHQPRHHEEISLVKPKHDRHGMAVQDTDPLPRNQFGLGKDLPPTSEMSTEERLRIIHHVSDLIHGVPPLDGPIDQEEPTFIVAVDSQVLVIAIAARDRPGLLLDISQVLLRLHLQLRHAEAAVLHESSLSTWRCEYIDGNHELSSLEQIESELRTMLATLQGAVEARKVEGLRVHRVRVIRGSKLIGKIASEIDFRGLYKAALVTIHTSDPQDGVKAPRERKVQEGDIMVLEVDNDSPLLIPPTPGFYEFLNASGKGSARSDGFGVRDIESDAETEYLKGVWRDLQLIALLEHSSKDSTAKEFLTAMKVAPGSKLTGVTAVQAGLDKILDCFLVSIDRPQSREQHRAALPTLGADSTPRSSSRIGTFQGLSDLPVSKGEVYTAIARDEELKEGDILWFSGHAHAVGELRKIAGLVSYEDEEVKKLNAKAYDRRLVQAVVARNGELNGKTVKEVGFRTKYGAAVIAVHREGKRVHDHPGNVKLRAGDVLLLEAGSSFVANASVHHKSFALFSEVKDSAPPRMKLVIPALIITAAMIVLFTTKVKPLLVCALVASILMIGMGLLSEKEARDCMNWEIFVTIGSAFGIGTAMINSGVAGGVAGYLVDLGESMGLGHSGLYGAVYLATFLISNVVTNNAAAALIFPIAINAAEKANADFYLMCYSVMLGASASFMSPYGYQTNLLIYGPGGYKYMDFVYIGLPLQIFLWILSTLFLSYDILLWSMAGTGVLLLAVIVIAVTGEYFVNKNEELKGKSD